MRQEGKESRIIQIKRRKTKKAKRVKKEKARPKVTLRNLKMVIQRKAMERKAKSLKKRRNLASP